MKLSLRVQNLQIVILIGEKKYSKLSFWKWKINTFKNRLIPDFGHLSRSTVSSKETTLIKSISFSFMKFHNCYCKLMNLTATDCWNLKGKKCLSKWKKFGSVVNRWLVIVHCCVGWSRKKVIWMVTRWNTGNLSGCAVAETTHLILETTLNILTV